MAPTSSSKASASVKGWEEHPRVDSLKRRAEAKGKSVRVLESGSASGSAAVGSLEGSVHPRYLTASVDPDIAACKGYISVPNSRMVSATSAEPSVVTSKSPDRESFLVQQKAEHVRLLLQKEEQAVRTRCELEEARILIETQA